MRYQPSTICKGGIMNHLRTSPKYIVILILLLLTVSISSAQQNDNNRQIAIDAANAAIPGLGQPTAWTFVILNNITDSSLGCALVEGTPIEATTVIAYTLTFGSIEYVVHVSADGTRRQLCDNKFPGIGTDAPTTTTTGCNAVTNTLIETYPTPEVTTGNFSLPAGTYPVAGRNEGNSWLLLVIPTAGTGNYWVQRVNVAATTGDTCNALPVVGSSPNATTQNPFDCQITTAVNNPTYPTPAITTANYTLPIGTFSVNGRNADDTWLSVMVPGGTQAPYWLSRVAVIGSTGAGCLTLPVLQANTTSPQSPNVPATGCLLTPIDDFANVRSAPTTEAGQVARIQAGTSSAILGRNAEQTWYRISEGWVLFSVVNLSGECGSIPLLDSSTDLEDVQPVTGIDAQYLCDFPSDLYLEPRIQLGRSTARVESGGLPNVLREQPSTNAPNIGNAQPGRTFDQVLVGPACNQGYVWWYVEIDELRGWTAESDGNGNAYFVEPVEGLEAEASTGSTLENGVGFDGFTSAITSLEFSEEDPDLLAILDNEAPLAALYDVTTLQQTGSTLTAETNFGQIIPLSGNRIAVSYESGNIRILNLADGEFNELEGAVSVQFGLGFDISPDEELLATGGCAVAGTEQDCAQGVLTLYDLTDLSVIRNVIAHENAVYGVQFNPDERFVATRSTDGVRLWSVETGDQLRYFEANDFVEAMDFDPDSREIAIASCASPEEVSGTLVCNQEEIRFWDVASQETTGVIQTDFPVYAIAFSPDGTLFAYAGLDGNVYLWDLVSEVLLETFEGHELPVRVLDFNADGTLLASGSDDATVRLWEIPVFSAG